MRVDEEVKNMADVNNVFGGIEILANSNSEWITSSQKLIHELIVDIEKHLDNVEYVIKNAEKSGCSISDLESIYSMRLDVYEDIVNLMSKINEISTKEIEIQKNMYEKEYQKYKDIFEVLKHTDTNSQI